MVRGSSTESTEYEEYSSGRGAVFSFLSHNPRLSVMDLEQKLREKGFLLKRQTIKNYKTEWFRVKAYSENGVVPSLHNGLGKLESEFSADLWKEAPAYGWRISKNRNCERLWSKSGIHVFWSRNGMVRFSFKGSRPRGHLLGVFSHAFWLLLLSTGKSERELSDYLKDVFEKKYREYAHFAWETGQPQPKMTINHFSKSLGLKIKLGDSSHPTSLEIEQREPPWASDLKDAAILFTKNIKSHVAVMRATKKAVAGLERVAEKLLQERKEGR